MNKYKLIIPGVLLITATTCNKSTTLTVSAIVDCGPITYSQTIAPIFQANCIGCHGVGSSEGPLTTHSQVKVYVDNGKLKDEVIVSQSMPTGQSLTSEELGQLQCWLEAGAPNN